VAVFRQRITGHGAIAAARRDQRHLALERHQPLQQCRCVTQFTGRDFDIGSRAQQPLALAVIAEPAGLEQRGQPQCHHGCRQPGSAIDHLERRRCHAELAEQRLLVQPVLRRRQRPRAGMDRHPAGEHLQAACRDVLEIEGHHIDLPSQFEQCALIVVIGDQQFAQGPGAGVGGRVEKHKLVRPGQPGQRQHPRQLPATDDADPHDWLARGSGSASTRSVWAAR
jgi:hypothetical protein